jgi:hypothetical protein
MGMSKKDIENIKEMNTRLKKKKKPGFWGGIKKGMQARAQENRTRRIEENKIRKEAFIKGRRAEIKRLATAKGKASARGFTYTTAGNYNPIGTLFDTGMKPAPGPKKRSKGKKKGKKKSQNRASMVFDPVDNWGLW